MVLFEGVWNKMPSTCRAHTGQCCGCGSPGQGPGSALNCAKKKCFAGKISAPTGKRKFPHETVPARPPPPPCVTFRRVVVSSRGPGQSSLRMLCRCFLSAAAAGAPVGVVSAFMEPSGWCAGAVLDVAGCAVCSSAVPSSWRTGGCAGCCGGRLTVLAAPTPPSSGRPQPASLCFRVRDAPPPSCMHTHADARAWAP